ncbi:hypothetical protein SAMN05444274_10922 [Mariniphaga anaerophila]|uniref:Uncharacterized protein n=1 Tax=Mariniphaga anaerophila TaxID=1484053 RepID=A0A1M5EG40_9BACT|nr:DUF6146 family protein [Mariniphaga anaerophila]SHF78198.1 hypothetical protein SAMN05444274_10922 [Mariniphaga anaerophila]
MKQLLFITGVLLFVWACSTQKGVVKIEENKDDIIDVQDSVEQDSLQYELETFDAKFKTWYALHDNPSQYRSQEYYENWNRQYVVAWNSKSTQPGKSSFFEPIVGYEPNIDYGFELNHKLFYYFQYVERVLKIKIMPGSPQGIAL